MSHVAAATEEIIPRDQRPNHMRKGGAPARNLNAISSLMYIQRVEDRFDGRSTLGRGLKTHRRHGLALFGCQFKDLNGVEAERLRRYNILTCARELATGRMHVAIEAGDQDAYAIAEKRFLAIAVAEERAELRLLESVQARKLAQKPVNLHERLLRSTTTPTPQRMPIPCEVEDPVFPFALVPNVTAPLPAEGVSVSGSADAPSVDPEPVLSDWACVFCGFKEFACEKPRSCTRCHTSRFTNLKIILSHPLVLP